MEEEFRDDEGLKRAVEEIVVEEKVDELYFKNKEDDMLFESKKLADSDKDAGGFDVEMNVDAEIIDVDNNNIDVVFEEVEGIHNESDLRQEEAKEDKEEQGDEGQIV